MDPVTAAINVFNGIVDLFGKDKQRLMLRQQQLIESQPEYKRFLAERKKDNTPLIVLGIVSFLAIIVIAGIIKSNQK